MRILNFVLISLSLYFLSSSGLYAKLIFTDHFDRADGSAETDAPGNGWVTNSAGRAEGDKQTFLRDGTLAIEISPRANHAVSVRRNFLLSDCTVALRFKIGEKDRLGVNFNDPELKSSHAGHVCGIRITTTDISIADQMNGSMNLAIRKRREAGEDEKALKAEIAKTERKGKFQLKPGSWHELVLETQRDTLRIFINGQLQLQHKSPGFAHPAKRNIALSIPKKVVVDNFRVWDQAGRK